MRITRLAPSIIACWVLAGRHLSLRSLVTDSLLGIYAHFIASPIFSMFLAGSILGIIVSRPCRHDDERDPSSRATELEGERVRPIHPTRRGTGRGLVGTDIFCSSSRGSEDGP